MDSNEDEQEKPASTAEAGTGGAEQQRSAETPPHLREQYEKYSEGAGELIHDMKERAAFEAKWSEGSWGRFRSRLRDRWLRFRHG
jgi:hypothetical protein